MALPTDFNRTLPLAGIQRSKTKEKLTSADCHKNTRAIRRVPQGSTNLLIKSRIFLAFNAPKPNKTLFRQIAQGYS